MTRQRPIMQIFASANWGGGEQFVYDLTRRLLEEGRPVVAVCRPGGAVEQRIAGLDIPSHAVSMKHFTDVVAIVRLARLIRRYEPSVIHVHQFKDAFIAVLARMLCGGGPRAPRIVLSRHLVLRGHSGRFYGWFYRRIVRIAFVSQLARKAFLSSHPRVDAERLSVVHNSTPDVVPGAAARDLRAEYGIAPDTPLMLFTGRCVPEKGCDILLEACSLLDGRGFGRYVLFLAGSVDSVYRKTLEERIRTGGLTGRVFLLGFVEQVKPLLAQCDIGVFPSVGCESFGLSMIEGMQAGCAVVTTDNGAQPEYMTDGREALLVPPADADALARALARLLGDDELRRSLGSAARKRFVEELSYERFYRKICQLYE